MESISYHIEKSYELRTTNYEPKKGYGLIFIFFLTLFATTLFAQPPVNGLLIYSKEGFPCNTCDVYYDGKFHARVKDNGVYYFNYDSSKGSYHVTVKDNYDNVTKNFKFSFDKGNNDLPSHYMLLNTLGVTLDMQDHLLNRGGLAMRPRDNSDLQSLFDKYEEAGVTDVFVTVFANGKTIFPTKVKGIVSSEYDYLKKIIEEGKKRGIRIRASLNTLNWGPAKRDSIPRHLDSTKVENPNGRGLESNSEQEDIRAKRGSIPRHLDSTKVENPNGRGLKSDSEQEDIPFKKYLVLESSILSKLYYKDSEDEKFLFVSPDHPEVVRILSELVSEIAINYRDLYGIHFNYMRYKKGHLQDELIPRLIDSINISTSENYNQTYPENQKDESPYKQVAELDTNKCGVDFADELIHSLLDGGEESPWLKFIEHRENTIHNLIVKLIGSIRDTNSTIAITAMVKPDYKRGVDLTCANPADWLNYIDFNNLVLDVEYKNLKDEFETVEIGKFYGFISFRKDNLGNEKNFEEFLNTLREKQFDITLYLSDPSILNSIANRKTLLNIMFRDLGSRY